MQEQPRVDPFGASTFFRDGMAMRRPPRGTIPVELRADAAGSAERIPIVIDRALLERGRARFEVFCAACHGIGGDGESVVAQNMQLRKPPSLLDERIRALPFGRLYAIVRGGYGLMPGYAAQLSVEERWATVAYVRALQISRHSPVSSLPADVRAELEKAHP
jgi:mono/diheme cytochrome c family protein